MTHSFNFVFQFPSPAMYLVNTNLIFVQTTLNEVI